MRPWPTLRSRFNHDWLKNQYLLALSNWIDLLERDENERRDVDFEQSFVADTLPQWERRRSQAVEIARGAIGALSPRHLCDRPPLNRCPDQVRVPLAELAHRLWLARSGVREAVASVESAIAEVDKAYAEVGRRLSGDADARSRAALRPFLSEFVRLRDACGRLGDALEKLPQMNTTG